MIPLYGSALLTEAIGEDDDPWGRFTEAVVESTEYAFERAVREALAASRRFDKATVAELDRYLQEFQALLQGTMENVELTDFGQHRYRAINDAIDRARIRLQLQVDGLIQRAATEQAALALASVDGPLRAILGTGATLPMVDLPLQQINFIRSYTPDLITAVTDETIRKVQTTLSQRLMGGLDAVRARRRIEMLVGQLPKDRGKTARQLMPGKIFSRQRIRAENILRTEMNRIYNITTTDRIDDVAVRVPGVGKTWIHNPGSSFEPRPNHVALHGTVIFPGNGERFTLYGRGGTTYYVSGPHDPALPGEESINCHCRVRVAYSGEVAAEQERRGLKAPRPSSRKN